MTGDITPDTVVVDKVTGETVEYRVGDKGGDRGRNRASTVRG